MIVFLPALGLLAYSIATTIRRRRRASTVPTARRPVWSGSLAPQPDEDLASPSPAHGLWTALDELQLIRLLTDSAP